MKRRQPKGAARAAHKVCVLALLPGMFLLSACGESTSPGGGVDNAGGDFAVLAQADARFEQARPGYALEFPRDHGAHPGYRIEWWYVTANLQDEQGRDWGLQWTLFRSAVTPPRAGLDMTGPATPLERTADAAGAGPNPWQQGQVFMGHFAVSSPAEHRAFQRYARGGNHDGLRQAGVDAAPFAAWLDEWRLASTGAEWLPLALSASEDGVTADLLLESDLPFILQGDEGFSQKHSEGGGSYYYSHPFLQATGELTFAGETVAVQGKAWLDREWSSQFLQPDQRGWDWFALHLDDGSRLMAFQLRSRSGSPYRHAVRLWPDGRRSTAAPGELLLEVLETERVAGRELPLGWALAWPQEGLSLRVRAAYSAQWMNLDFPYWEGRVEVLDRASEERVGVGYLEMTGYSREPNP